MNMRKHFWISKGSASHPKDKANLFDPYRQLRHGKAQGMGGAGLGPYPT